LRLQGAIGAGGEPLVCITHEHGEHREGDSDQERCESAYSGVFEPGEGRHDVRLGGGEERLRSVRRSGEHECEDVDETGDDAQGYGGDFFLRVAVIDSVEEWRRG
jgi:hypothetical protein